MYCKTLHDTCTKYYKTMYFRFVDLVPGTPSCKFTTHATVSEVGFWTCHLWTPTAPQEEITKTVEVRVAHKFAALDKEIVVKKGDRVTLSCVSSEGRIPLNECSFTSPEQQLIHMDDKITEEKFFYPPHLSVHRGDCSITLQSTDLTDEGTWTCTGWLELENRAYTDYIHLRVLDVTEATSIDNKPFIISVAIFICVTLALLVFLALICWKERYYTRFYGKKWDDESLESFGMTTDTSQILVRDSFRTFNVNGAVKILALENEWINIQCKQDTPMAYCGFVHPSGKRYSFSGSELTNGHCAIPIKATRQDVGKWRCHIGRKLTGVEDQQIIELRVVDKIAAIRNNITTVHRKDVTLECATTEGYKPLSYCRFEPPNGPPFSIDSAVNYTKSILGRYYFPQNKSLDRGDCAVTIRKVKYEDVGIWTCGASLSDGKEYTDTVELIVEGIYTMSTASATGVTFGAIGIGAFLIILGYLGWKRRSFLGVAPRQEVHDEGHEMGEMPQARNSPQSRRSSISRRSPQTSRVPSVVVQSPSETGSPLITSGQQTIEQ
ncbi:uncharacterized protein LOC133517345 isoform X2 [Cydia pomonella]|uniref:uncharacterized protein LOC133517345 isoform X2 n=1 Tax=Cydia pomonella TaxID=82600 RepID=UPI002ADE8C9C|nr:uncharacterized protein LOC133517345 isoform X2 [Cydia pomonella]